MTALIFAATVALSSGMSQQSAPKGYNHADAIWLASRVQAYYNKTTDFKAKFKQVYSKAYHGPQTPRWGYMWVKKPGLMRWDYTSPRKKQLICDGQKIWIYDPGYKQVFWRDVKTSAIPTAVSFLWGKGNIVNEFYVMIVSGSKYAKPGTKVLRLMPKLPNSNFKHVLFVVDSKTAIVVETVVYDHLSNKNHYFFMNATANTGVTRVRFSFKPPAGVRVIRAEGNNMNPATQTPPPRRRP
ncbi:MAG: outer membrane lipoprotein chaperone LolA [bacterium]